jgi:hypothetical protein
VAPAIAAFGDALPLPVGALGVSTFTPIFALPLRDCASVIVTARFFAPAPTPSGTTALYEKMPSFAVTSPLVPSS